ncbi:uncharacterized protein LOC143031250 [Oratosquilla oratoria]|uniref:uncharacterized protein LOC143031250 n=1 Tax=Oratosquilla oratoria TaxID=337810 RepID=UPI003F77115F
MLHQTRHFQTTTLSEMDKEISWSTDAIFCLIEKVRQQEALWSVKHPHYHKKNLKRSLFDQICRELKEEYPDMDHLNTDHVVTKFQYLRGHFQKQLRKIQNTPNESGGRLNPKWIFFQACSFMHPVYSNNNDDLSYELANESIVSPTEGLVPYESLLEVTVDSPAENEESQSSGHNLDSSSRTPSPEPAPVLNTTQSHPPKNSKTRKRVNSDDILQNKIMETLDCLQESLKAKNQVPLRFDAATEAVMACMNYIPASKPHLKAELTQKVFVLVSDIIQKCNSEFV